MNRFFRYKHLETGTVHKVEKRRNGKPWIYTVCNFRIGDKAYASTREAVNCEFCLRPQKPKKYDIDPAWANADPDDAFVIPDR